MVPNKIVVRYQNGRILKGFTNDFLPTKDIFHLTAADTAPGTKPLEVRTGELKAIFFVRDFAGRPEHDERKQFDPIHPVPGRKIQVVFKDGEQLIGTTQGYQPGRPGFFLIPADPQSNIERCYVVSGATRNVAFT